MIERNVTRAFLLRLNQNLANWSHWNMALFAWIEHCQSNFSPLI